MAIKKKKATKKWKRQILKNVSMDPIEHSLSNKIKNPAPAIWPDGKHIKIQDEPIGEKLTLRQERFCQLYTDEGSFFGNGVQAYLEVYDIDTTKTGWYKTACVAASQILSNIKVCNRINELLSDAGLNKEFMDKQLLYVATQHADMTNKMSAIKEFNRITKRVEDNPGTTIKVYVVDEVKQKKFQEMKEKLSK